jgi:hypothetical protein
MTKELSILPPDLFRSLVTATQARPTRKVTHDILGAALDAEALGEMTIIPTTGADARKPLIAVVLNVSRTEVSLVSTRHFFVADRFMLALRKGEALFCSVCASSSSSTKGVFVTNAKFVAEFHAATNRRRRPFPRQPPR